MFVFRKTLRFTALRVLGTLALALTLLNCGKDKPNAPALPGPGANSTPAIVLSESAVTLGLTEGGGGGASKSISVTNGGSGTLSGLSASLAYNPGSLTGGLSAFFNTLTAPATLTIGASATNLAAGDYSATVTVSSSDASVSPKKIAVSFNIISAANGSIKVITSTTGSNLDPSGYVISVKKSSGLAETVSVGINGFRTFSNLSPGLHEVTLSAIESNCNASGSNPRMVNVVAGQTTETTFDIACQSTAAPRISLNKSSLSFSAVQSGSLPGNQSFTISNSGTGTLNWSVSDNATWLSVSPTSGNNNSQSVVVSINTTNLNTLTYIATITVSSNNATNSPRTIGVSYTVTAAPQTRQITIINNMSTSLNLHDVVQLKVVGYQNGFSRSDLLTDDPAQCLGLMGESIKPGQSRTFDITIGNNYSVFLGIGIWDLDNFFCSSSRPFIKRRWFTESPSGNIWYVYKVVNVTGHTGGNWNWTISGSYLTGTLGVTPAGNSPIRFDISQTNPIP